MEDAVTGAQGVGPNVREGLHVMVQVSYATCMYKKGLI
jgi:hypothetical protein